MKVLDLISSVLGIISLILAHYFPDASAAMYAVGGTLLAGGVPQISSLARKTPGGPPSLASLLFLVGFLGCSSATVAKERAFWQSVVACSKGNPESLEAKRAALACVAATVGGEYFSCAATVVPSLIWTAEELMCVATTLPR